MLDLGVLRARRDHGVGIDRGAGERDEVDPSPRDHLELPHAEQQFDLNLQSCLLAQLAARGDGELLRPDRAAHREAPTHRGGCGTGAPVTARVWRTRP